MSGAKQACRTCRYWQGIIPSGKDTTWLGCMVAKNMLQMKNILDPAWVNEVGHQNFEVMGGNYDVVATKDTASCSLYRRQLDATVATLPLVYNRRRSRAGNAGERVDPLNDTLSVLTHNVYHKESSDEGIVLDAILHYCGD